MSSNIIGTAGCGKTLDIKSVGEMCDEIKALKAENEKLKQKATAWDIVNNGADWQHLRDLCDQEMCEELIQTGECVEADFEGYEWYGQLKADEIVIQKLGDTIRELLPNDPHEADKYIDIAHGH